MTDFTGMDGDAMFGMSPTAIETARHEDNRERVFLAARLMAALLNENSQLCRENARLTEILTSLNELLCASAVNDVRRPFDGVEPKMALDLAGSHRRSS